MDIRFLRKKIMKKLFAAVILAVCLGFSVSMQTSTDSSLRAEIWKWIILGLVFALVQSTSHVTQQSVRAHKLITSKIK